jgi:hypothetical protein
LASSRFGSITGKIFVDINGSGQQDPGEPGMDNQAVALWYQGTIFGLMPTRSLDLNGDDVLDPVTEAGFYSFEGLLPDAYEVNNLFFFGLGLPGWTQVFPSLNQGALSCIGEVSSGPSTSIFTNKVSTVVQPLADVISIQYSVCLSYRNTGLLMEGSLKPVAGVQL